MRNTLRVSETFLFPFALGVVRRCGCQALAYDVGESQERGVFSLCRSGSGGPGPCQTAHAVHSYFVWKRRAHRGGTHQCHVACDLHRTLRSPQGDLFR